MTPETPQQWLLLIHQIPPKPDALRVKIWRWLQQIGAVAIKQSVYALPRSAASLEDFSWILKEITDGGGDGSILESRFIQGLNDTQIIRLFENARKTDYEKIITQANTLLAMESLDEKDTCDIEPIKISKLQKKLKEIIAIDFFNTPERGTAELLINEVLSARKKPVSDIPADNLAAYKDKTWITRSQIFIDRMACGWFIRRFIDENARFKYVTEPHYTPLKDEIRFDMVDAEFTHQGDLCSFEVMMDRFHVKNKAVSILAEMVHDIDLKEHRYGHNETEGFKALLTGLSKTLKTDDQRMSQGMQIFDNLYAYFRHTAH